MSGAAFDRDSPETRASWDAASQRALDNVVQWHIIALEGGIREDIEIELVDEASEGEVATIKVRAGGAVLFIMGEIKEDGKRLVVGGVYVSSDGVSPNEVGVPSLRQVARAVMEIGGS